MKSFCAHKVEPLKDSVLFLGILCFILEILSNMNWIVIWKVEALSHFFFPKASDWETSCWEKLISLNSGWNFFAY